MIWSELSRVLKNLDNLEDLLLLGPAASRE